MSEIPPDAILAKPDVGGESCRVITDHRNRVML